MPLFLPRRRLFGRHHPGRTSHLIESAMLLASPGLIVIPKDKLLRAAYMVRETLAFRADWNA